MFGYWRKSRVPELVPDDGQPADSCTWTVCVRVCFPAAVAVQLAAAGTAAPARPVTAASASRAIPHSRSLLLIAHSLPVVRFSSELGEVKQLGHAPVTAGTTRARHRWSTLEVGQEFAPEYTDTHERTTRLAYR